MTHASTPAPTLADAAALHESLRILEAEHEGLWRARNRLVATGWHPCVRRLALGRDGCRGTLPRSEPRDEGCTCGWTFGAHDDLLVVRDPEDPTQEQDDAPAVLRGHHRRRVDSDDLRRWTRWTDLFPQLELVITGGSWIEPGGLVVVLYNREVWSRR